VVGGKSAVRYLGNGDWVLIGCKAAGGLAT
jgi:hypothetical protein